MLATVTDWLWSYVLIVALLAVGIRLTVAARFVQVRLFREMFRGLSGGFSGTEKGYRASKRWLSASLVA